MAMIFRYRLNLDTMIFSKYQTCIQNSCLHWSFAENEKQLAQRRIGKRAQKSNPKAIEPFINNELTERNKDEYNLKTT